MIFMATMMMLFWDLHTADDDDDDGGGGGGGGDDDDDNDNDKKQQKTKTLTDDCSALYWTQELGLTCLESGRRAASNEPSCFSRR